MNNKNTKAVNSILKNRSFRGVQTGRKDQNTLGDSVILYDGVQHKTNTLELIRKEFEEIGKKVFYIKAEQMLRELTSYMEKHFTTEGFYDLFTQYDYLLIDDSHILQNRSATQQEISYLIENLMTIGVSVIIKSTKKLNAIEQVVSKKYFWE